MSRFFVAIIAIAVSTVASTSFAQDSADELTQKASRIIAYGYFKSQLRQGVELDLESVKEGARLALEGEEIGMTSEEIQSVAKAFEEVTIKRIVAKREARSEKNKADGERFFAQNKTAEGVVALESGLQYKVLAEGQGKSPQLTDRVAVRYSGSLLDGTVFDETDAEGPPANFAVAGVVRGMTEALQNMKPGGKIIAYIPSDLAYGTAGPRDQSGRPVLNSPIGPDEALVFELELIEIIASPERAPGGGN